MPSSPNDVGVCLGGHWLGSSTDDEVARDLDKIAAIGFDAVRWDCQWFAVEQKKGEYWLDRRVKVAQMVVDRGMWNYLVGGYTAKAYQQPQYVKIDPSRAQFSPPAAKDYPALVNYWKAIVQALGVDNDLCHRWEFWNESNHHPFWYHPNVNEQMAMLAAVKPEVYKLDPDARIIFGAFSPEPTPNRIGSDGKEWGINAVEYVRRIYAGKSLKGLPDAYSIHPYVEQQSGTVTHNGSWSLLTTQYDAIRNHFLAGGTPKKRIWATEFGQATQAGSSGRKPVSEADQGKYIIEQMDFWRNHRDYHGPQFLFNYQEFMDGGKLNSLGIVKVDGTPKKAVAAIKEYLAK